VENTQDETGETQAQAHIRELNAAWKIRWWADKNNKIGEQINPEFKQLIHLFSKRGLHIKTNRTEQETYAHLARKNPKLDK
jgi:hypothetical protein